MREDTFVIRTIKNGKVKIKGAYYSPRHLLKPEMERKRFAFGLYERPDRDSGYEDFVCLWGTERLYHATQEEYHRIYNSQMDKIIENGKFMWEWWDIQEDLR